jgi:hypothetical protein
MPSGSVVLGRAERFMRPGRVPSTSPKPQIEEGHVDWVVFSSGPDAPAGGPGRG